RDVDLRLLLQKDDVLDFGAAQTAKFLGPGNRCIALGGLRSEKTPGLNEARIEIEHRVIGTRFDILGEPCTNLGAKFCFLWCVVKIHRGFPLQVHRRGWSSPGDALVLKRYAV